MMDNTQKKPFTGAVGFGSHSDRHEGGVDFATLGSPSHEGPNTDLTAGPVQNVVTAENLLLFDKRREERVERAGELDIPALSMCATDVSMELEVCEPVRTKSMDESSQKSLRKKYSNIEDNSLSSGDDASSTISMTSTRSTRSVDKATKRKRGVTRTTETDVGMGKRAKKREKESLSSRQGKATALQKENDEATNIEDAFDKAMKQPFKQPKSVAKTESELMSMSMEALQDLGFGWLDDIEAGRKRSSNLQGTISGTIKDRVISLRDLIKCMGEKAISKGDPIFFQMKLREVNAQLKIREQQEGKWQQEKAMKDREIKMLLGRNEKLEARVWKLSRGIKDDPLPITTVGRPSITVSDEEKWPALRPPIQGVRKLLTDDARKKMGGDPVSGSTSALRLGPDDPGSDPSGNKKSDISTEKTKAKETKFKTKKEKEMEEIRKQMRELSMRKKELLKEGRDTETEHEYEKETKQKLKPRIIEDVQLIPPRTTKIGVSDNNKDVEKTQGDWRIVNKRKKGRIKKQGKGQEQRQDKSRTSGTDKKPSNVSVSTARLRKPPRTASVAVTGKIDGVSYANILKKAREGISLSELGIENTRIRKGINGGVIIEIPGPEGKERADTLAKQLRDVLKDEEVKVTPLSIRAEIRISGFDDSVTADEILYTIADKGGCSIDEVKVGTIRWMNNGLGTTWAQCPLLVATKLIESGKIRVGWTIARVEILQKRPLQCYKCWAYGHVRFSCTATVNRSGICFNCGEAGHVARLCTALTFNCFLCKEKGLRHDHRLGTRFCNIDRQSVRGKPLPRVKPQRQDTERVTIRRPEQRMDVDDAV